MTCYQAWSQICPLKADVADPSYGYGAVIHQFVAFMASPDSLQYDLSKDIRINPLKALAETLSGSLPSEYTEQVQNKLENFVLLSPYLDITLIWPSNTHASSFSSTAKCSLIPLQSYLNYPAKSRK